MGNYRFRDWKNYILKQNLIEKRHDTIVLLVTFNQLENYNPKFYLIQTTEN